MKGSKKKVQISMRTAPKRALRLVARGFRTRGTTADREGHGFVQAKRPMARGEAEVLNQRKRLRFIGLDDARRPSQKKDGASSSPPSLSPWCRQCGRHRPLTAPRREELLPRSAARCGWCTAAQAPQGGLTAPLEMAVSVSIRRGTARAPPPPWLWCRCSVPVERRPAGTPLFSLGPALWWSAAARAMAIDCWSCLSMARSRRPRRR